MKSATQRFLGNWHCAEAIVIEHLTCQAQLRIQLRPVFFFLCYCYLYILASTIFVLFFLFLLYKLS